MVLYKTMKLLDPQLQAFVATSKHGTVHAAAHELHLTQTGITQRIKALENRLKVSLFVRSRRGMTLTKEGEALLRYCHSFIELEGEALASVTKTGTEKNVSICISGPTTILRSRIIPQCIKVMKTFPQLLLQFDMNDDENRIHSLRNGTSQLAIVEQSVISDEMQYKKLKPENYIFVVSIKWKNRRLKEIIQNEKIIDFEIHDQTTFNYLKKFDLFDLANKDRHFANRTDALALLIAEGMGYGVLPLEFAKPYLMDKQLVMLNKNLVYSHHLALAWYPRTQQPKYFASLIDACI